MLANTTGAYNTAIGHGSLDSNTEGAQNTAVGPLALADNTTGIRNTAIGYNTKSGNFNRSVILGMNAEATGDNQFVVGSTTENAGAVTTASVTATKRWKVKINGVDYYIPLEVA
jgi:hypothetical protein